MKKDNRRIRVALLVAHAEEKHQKSFIEGFAAEAFQYNSDVCVFAMYNKSQTTKTREMGESNIYSLINYEYFDAIVLLSDTIHTTGMADKLETVIKKNFKGPVVCLDRESDYFTNVKIDGYIAVKMLISHLIEVHGFRDIAFLTGRKGHPHSEERLQAYVDCLMEYNIPIRDNRIFYGDFWFGSGKNMVEALLKDKTGLPEAIACANDYMAIDVIEQLNACGYNVPADIAVTGFDSVDYGQNFPTSVTSYILPSKEYGVYVAKLIDAMLQKKEFPKYEKKVSLNIGNSCGCPNSHKINQNVFGKIVYKNLTQDFYSRYNHMMTDLLSKKDFGGLMETIKDYIYQLGDFEQFTLCLNDYWRNSDSLLKSDGLMEGYTAEMLPVLQCGKHIMGDPLNYNISFETKLMLPELHEVRGKPRIYFFTPLFFEERNFGYVAISYAKEQLCYDEVYWLWLRNVMYALEGYRRVTVGNNNEINLQKSSKYRFEVGLKFGEKLIRLREERNLSQEELADLLGVSRQSVSKWENDKGYPEMTRLLILSDYFEISLDELMR